MNIPWDDVAVFLAVAETGSVSRAATRLRTSQPTVSRRVAALEERLGAVLFQRGVTGTTLTAAGDRLLEPARRMAEWASEIERAAPGGVTPRGIVRITAPPGVAFDFLAPFAALVRRRLPDVRLEVMARIHYVDLARREADLALRVRAPMQADLVEVARLEHDVDAFATPAYIAKLPRGYELKDVDFIGWAPPYEHLAPNTVLEQAIPGFRPIFASDDFLVQWRAAEAGIGALFLGKVSHRFSRATGLRPLGLDMGPHSKGSLHLVAARSALDLPRVRAVAELLTEELAATGAEKR